MTMFQNIMAGAIPARLTVDQVYDLTAAGVFAENEHFELIDGEIVPMAAAKANWHDAMATKLNRALVRLSVGIEDVGDLRGDLERALQPEAS